MANEHDDSLDDLLDFRPPAAAAASRTAPVAGASAMPGTEFELAVSSDAELELDLPPAPLEAPAPPEPEPLPAVSLPQVPAPRREFSARSPLPRPRRRGPGWQWIAGGALVVVAVGAAIGLIDWGPEPPTAPPVAPPVAAPATRAVEGLVFAGHDLDWWQRRLQGLAVSPQSAELYQLTEQRARALGLEVERGASGVRVAISPALLQSLAQEPAP